MMKWRHQKPEGVAAPCTSGRKLTAKWNTAMIAAGIGTSSDETFHLRPRICIDGMIVRVYALFLCSGTTRTVLVLSMANRILSRQQKPSQSAPGHSLQLTAN